MALFKQHPRLRWRPKEGEQIIPLDVQGNYPTFAGDVAFLEQVLMPHFRTLDNEALRAQNQFLGVQVCPRGRQDNLQDSCLHLVVYPLYFYMVHSYYLFRERFGGTCQLYNVVSFLPL